MPYAICYVIVKNGTDVSFTTELSCDYDPASTYVIYAANEQGGLSKGVNPAQPDAIENEIATVEDVEIVAIYTADGIQLKELQKGINLVKMQDRQGNIFTRKVIK